MPVAITLHTVPTGSQFTSTIDKSVDPPEPDDKNDFKVRINLDSNGSGLALSSLSVSEGSIVSVDGSNSVWEATIRPPETAVDALTFTVAADAFSEGNTETTLDIRVSTSFPDDDAQAPTEVFTHSITTPLGIAATATGIKIRWDTSNSRIVSYDFSGTSLGTQNPSLNSGGRNGLDYINGDYLINGTGGTYRVDGQNLSNERLGIGGTTNYSIGHSRFGVLGTQVDGLSVFLRLYAYDDFADTHDFDDAYIGNTNSRSHAFAVQDDLVYIFSVIGVGNRSLYQLDSPTEIQLLRGINIAYVTDVRDASIYRDTLYFLTDDNVQSLDIRPYRPMTRNTKTTIYPVFATNSDTIPLKDYCPDADTIIFGLGFDKPDWLTINASDALEIASDAVTETTPVLVKVTGINYIDSVEFEFYLIVEPATAPVWRDVDKSHDAGGE